MDYFRYAICRKPASSAVNGLTTVDLGPPDLETLQRQHRNYVDTLQSLDVTVENLEPLEAFPDAWFTEDVAIVTPEVALLTRPGATQRRQEVEFIREPLSRYRELRAVNEGTVDGGDVLVLGKHCVIGLSNRTDRRGADTLAGMLGEYGYETDVVEVPEALHFKSSVNFLDDNTLLVTQACANIDCLAPYRKFVVPEGEEYAANVVWINDRILVPAGFEGTSLLLREQGYETIEMPVSEVACLDGGLTCLSLRLT